MNFKSILKSLKLNESTISMMLGAIVIVVVGVLVINYFKYRDSGTTIPALETQEINLPVDHVVAKGEDLWKIAENYYDSGYNWVDIAEANDITNANMIEEGKVITIPNVEARMPIDEDETSPMATSPTPTTEPVVAGDTETSTTPISGTTYTVEKGDTLWDIAVRAYGDGYRWINIAEENDLDNPDIIHSGNVFILPE